MTGIWSVFIVTRQCRHICLAHRMENASEIEVIYEMSERRQDISGYIFEKSVSNPYQSSNSTSSKAVPIVQSTFGTPHTSVQPL